MDLALRKGIYDYKNNIYSMITKLLFNSFIFTYLYMYVTKVRLPIKRDIN
jgi:hypothetical protein